jgi:hypothetical protein
LLPRPFVGTAIRWDYIKMSRQHQNEASNRTDGFSSKKKKERKKKQN